MSSGISYGDPAGDNLIGRVKVTDGTNVAAVKAASTPPAPADPAMVVTISPNTTSITLLTNASSTGAGVAYNGGHGFFTACGTFTSGSVKLQFLGPDGSTYIDVQAMDPSGVFTTVSLAANGGFAFDLPATTLKAVVTGTVSGIYATAARIPA